VPHEQKKQSTGSTKRTAGKHQAGLDRANQVNDDKKRGNPNWKPRGKGAGNQAGKGKQPKQPKQQKQAEVEIDEGLEW